MEDQQIANAWNEFKALYDPPNHSEDLNTDPTMYTDPSYILDLPSRPKYRATVSLRIHEDVDERAFPYLSDHAARFGQVDFIQSHHVGVSTRRRATYPLNTSRTVASSMSTSSATWTKGRCIACGPIHATRRCVISRVPSTSGKAS